jgi:crotonobetainyl-CoA:carnitine CoA-transferase CaiB-like acyl-CoA transferase
VDLQRSAWPVLPPHPGPLGGVRVLDLSRVLAGPYAAMVLADLGADVIKVERPGAGDDTRSWGPPFHGPDATYFLSVNRNRRAVGIDISTPDGLAVIATLARAADVVLENFLPRHLRSLGLADLRSSVDATWVSIRGAGSDGPDGELPGYDVMAQARSGLMHVTGPADGEATKVGVAISDIVAGLHAAVGALAGVIASDRTGTAPRIEVPLLESTVAALVNQTAAALVGGADPVRMGVEHPSVVPYGPLPCADAPLVVGAGNDRQFASLAAVLGLADDPRFAANAGRVAHREELRALLVARLARKPAAEWAGLLAAAGVPSAPVQSVREALADPQVAGLLVETEHDGEPVTLVGSPYLLDGVRPVVRSGPPALGRDTDEVLTGLGLSAADVETLRTRGVVA